MSRPVWCSYKLSGRDDRWRWVAHPVDPVDENDRPFPGPVQGFASYAEAVSHAQRYLTVAAPTEDLDE